jgi:hypothetical protein
MLGRESLMATTLFSKGFGKTFSKYESAVGRVYSCKFSPAGDAIVIGHSGSPFVTAYPWSPITGIGTAFSPPASLPASVVRDIDFSPSGDAIILASASYVSGLSSFAAYSWSSSTGFGARLPDPSVIYAKGAQSVSFHPSGEAVLLGWGGGGAAPSADAYRWSSAGFGTKYADPSQPIQYGVDSCRFSPSGDVAAFALSFYQWSLSTGFGSRYPVPPSPPVGGLYFGLAFNPTGNVVILDNPSISPYLFAYKWSYTGGFGDQYAAPQTTITPSIGWRGPDFHPSGKSLMYRSSYYFQAIEWDDTTGFGRIYRPPNVSVLTTAWMLDCSPLGDSVVGVRDGDINVFVCNWSQ